MHGVVLSPIVIAIHAIVCYPGDVIVSEYLVPRS